MKECIKCHYTEIHPLGITFDDEGVCSGCRVHEEKDVINWDEKWSELEGIAAQYKVKNRAAYDCIVPVSGARDSYYILHLVKNRLGLNPLLVTYNKQYNTDLGIRNLANLRTEFNSDIYTLSVNPEKLKKITRQTLITNGSMYWHCLAGQTVFPVQIAVKLKIPLIIWGAHQGVDQVGMYSHHHKVEMSRRYRKDHDLMGYEAEDLIDKELGLKEKDLFQFFYPENEEIQNVGVRGIYLNNYVRWDTKAQHEAMLKTYNYETDYQTRTIDNYNDVDCFNYSDVHDYIKYMKYGYSKIHDHVTREIRFNRLTKEEGLAYVAKYENKHPKNLDQFSKWIGISENAFQFLIDQHRDPRVWIRDSSFQWRKKSEPQTPKIAASEKLNFLKTPNKRPDYEDNKYIIIGKGKYDY